MLILLGANEIDSPVETGRVQVAVENIFVHPQWNISATRYDADLAICVLSESVKYSIYIRPICLPNADPVDSYGSIAGKKDMMSFRQPVKYKV